MGQPSYGRIVEDRRPGIVEFWVKKIFGELRKNVRNVFACFVNLLLLKRVFFFCTHARLSHFMIIQF